MAKRKRKNKYKSKNKRDRLNMDKGGVVRNPYNRGSLAINPLQPLDPRPSPDDDAPGYSSPPDYRVMGNTVNQGVTVQDRGTGLATDNPYLDNRLENKFQGASLYRSLTGKP